jgi:hypothetical protein
MAKAFGKNAPKYGAQCKSFSLKYVVKFQQKCRLNRTACLLNAGAFVQSKNWLVKLTLEMLRFEQNL